MDRFGKQRRDAETLAQRGDIDRPPVLTLVIRCHASGEGQEIRRYLDGRPGRRFRHNARLRHDDRRHVRYRHGLVLSANHVLFGRSVVAARFRVAGGRFGCARVSQEGAPQKRHRRGGF